MVLEPSLALQGVRTALLRLLIHMVVANSALVPLCLRVLVLAMQAPSGPLKQNEEAAVTLAAWQPAPDTVEIQGEVIAALEKVSSSCRETIWEACISICGSMLAITLSQRTNIHLSQGRLHAL